MKFPPKFPALIPGLKMGKTAFQPPKGDQGLGLNPPPSLDKKPAVKSRRGLHFRPPGFGSRDRVASLPRPQFGCSARGNGAPRYLSPSHPAPRHFGSVRCSRWPLFNPGAGLLCPGCWPEGLVCRPPRLFAVRGPAGGGGSARLSFPVLGSFIPDYPWRFLLFTLRENASDTRVSPPARVLGGR